MSFHLINTNNSFEFFVLCPFTKVIDQTADQKKVIIHLTLRSYSLPSLFFINQKTKKELAISM